jgi:Bacterial TniB protein
MVPYGSPREQRVILQLFRYLSNELKASLVCLGVAEARDGIAGDIQLAPARSTRTATLEGR